jgi:hypothetical protein
MRTGPEERREIEEKRTPDKERRRSGLRRIADRLRLYMSALKVYWEFKRTDFAVCGSTVTSASGDPCQNPRARSETHCYHCREFIEMCKQHDEQENAK